MRRATEKAQVSTTSISILQTIMAQRRTPIFWKMGNKPYGEMVIALKLKVAILPKNMLTCEGKKKLEWSLSVRNESRPGKRWKTGLSLLLARLISCKHCAWHIHHPNAML
jgi:hypothetical protein